MPRETDSTTKFKADISQLKAAMQEASRSVRLASSEFKAATAGMDDWSKTADGLSAKTKQLNSTLEAQKKQLASLEKQYELTVKEQGENSKGAEELAIRINNQKAAIKTTETSLNSYEKALDDVQSAAEDAGDSAQKASDGFTVMKGALASLVADGIRATISGLKELASQAFDAGSSFESAMSQVGAVSGANAEQLDQLTAKAQEMGAKTKFSASESAEAFNYMAMAGWKTEEMLGGIEGIMNLAAASGADLATTSDIVTDALTAMGYAASDAGRLADVMAAASSNANTNVEMMGKTFQYAAPIVGALGMSMEDTAVAIGMMANAGIKADKAGTALRSILTRLSAPPKECATEMDKLGLSMTDSSGKMKSLNTVMLDLRKAFSNLSETEQTAAAKHLAGAEAMSGLLAIVNGSETDFNKLTMAIEGSTGAAQKMADTMNDNVNGQLTLLKSQIEGIMIKLFDRASASMRKGITSISTALDNVDWDKIGDAVGKFAEKAADLFSYIITNGSSIINTLTTIGTIAATLFAVDKIGSFIGWLNSLMRTYTSLNAVMTAVKGTQLALNAAQLATPVGALVVALGALVAVGLKVRQQNEELAKSNAELTDAEKELNAETQRSYDAQKQLYEERNKNVEAATGEFEYIKRLKDEYNGLIDKNGEVKKGYEDRTNFIMNQLAEALGMEVSEVQTLIDKNGELGKSIDDLIVKKQAEATLSAYDESYKQAKYEEKEALDKVIENQNKYTESKQKYLEIQAKYSEVEKQSHDDMMNGGNATYYYQNQLQTLEKQLNTAKDSLNQNKQALEQSNEAYVNGQTTIKNYEGLSSAIISGDVTKINDELTKLTNGFKDASSTTESELKAQVDDYKKYYDHIKSAMDAGNPVITKQMVNDAKEMWEKAKAEYDSAKPKMKKSGEDNTKAIAEGAKSKSGEVEKASKEVAEKGKKAADKEVKNYKKSGEEGAKQFSKGVESKKSDAEKSASTIAKAGKKKLDDAKKDTEKSGNNFGYGFANGITAKDVLTKVGNAAKKLVDWALSKLKKEQKEGSPSKVTAQSGKFFGLGYEVGINATQKVVGEAAANLANVALTSLREAQQEGSPSKATYKSGKNFTQGFIKGIVSLQSTLVKTSQKMVKSVINELLKLKNYNFSEVQQNASNAFSSATQKKLSYTLDRINYANQKKLESFDKNISSYNDKREKELTKLAVSRQEARDAAIEEAKSESYKRQQKLQNRINRLESQDKLSKNEKKFLEDYKAELKELQLSLDEELDTINSNYENSLAAEQNAIKEKYKKLIEAEQSGKQAYQQASQKMIQEFNTAMSQYQTAAQKLIDDTMNGVTSKYQAQYNALISKQDALISKLKSAGDLFNINNANVMTVNDLKAQTEQITRYANKLKDIKSKVSSDLFDQISSYDMEQGEAFIDRLLSMSRSELDAYNKAYTEKMEAAEKLSQDIYKKDLEKVEKDYKSEVKKAFSGIEKELKELGEQSMKGFVEGLTADTDYMKGEVKNYIDEMIAQFKKQLDIHSPSKVMEKLGKFTGEGFADGLKDMVRTVKKAAEDITDTVTNTLDFGDMGGIRSLANNYNGNGSKGVYGANSGTTTQIINFNQTNNSPKALDRLTIYRQTNNMLFGAKVRLNNV